MLHTIKRDGSIVPFVASKIEAAVAMAFLKDADGNSRAGTEHSAAVRDKVSAITAAVVSTLVSRPNDGTIHIEDIQDQVELALMRSGEHKVARDYVLYRERRAQSRQVSAPAPISDHVINVQTAGGDLVPLDMDGIRASVELACAGTIHHSMVDHESLLKQAIPMLYDGMPERDVNKALVFSARSLIERDSSYAFVAAGLFLRDIRREVFGVDHAVDETEAVDLYPDYFVDYIQHGIAIGRLDPRLGTFNLHKLAAAINCSRDYDLQYLGLQILYDRYFIHENERRLELPQIMWMRVAMGLAINEIDREARAIEFYDVLSTFRFVCSTPTLFNAGTTHPQLSSCFLTTVPDDLEGIYDAIKENAMLSKFSGGLGNDWTPVRGMGAWIKGTNGKSQGVVPFLKVVNDTAVAVNQCFAPDTLVYTQHGAKPISQIHKGDLVMGISGTYREVLERMTYAQNDPMVEVRVKHSLSPERVTAGHPIFAIQGVPLGESSHRTIRRISKGKIVPVWADAGTLQVGDYAAQVIPSEIIPVEDFTENDAFLYGIMLGDGHVGLKNGLNREYGVTLNDEGKRGVVQFVRDYLENRGIHFWENMLHGSAHTIRWAYGREQVRNTVNGQFVTGDEIPVLPFTYADMYNENGDKHVAARFLHLPEALTLAMLKGLLLTDGHVVRGKDVFFNTASRALAGNMRYLLLRLGIACSGRQRDRRGESHVTTRKDGSQDIICNGIAYELRIPAYHKIAALVGCEPVTKNNAIRLGKWLFSRVTAIQPIQPVPFVCDLKVEGDESYMTSSFLAHNGGKRKGAVCAYLETWHIDMEEFLDLRKNTGDDRRRMHDMDTANWIPDLFMERMEANAEWTLFSPNEVPDLHDLFGRAFKDRYEEYERLADEGKITLFKRVKAVELWRKMLGALFETGHPWITFKDPCNIRSPQGHAGVVHSSNLCTEITLNSSKDETAVCNLGSVNLLKHIIPNPVIHTEGEEQVRYDGKGLLTEFIDTDEVLARIDTETLERTVHTAMRMLDNVIDMNFYATNKARNANMRHRAVGLGLMGFADALFALKIPMDCAAAITFADVSQELISYFAIDTSADLARERGSYHSFHGSDWSNGILPIDTVSRLENERELHVNIVMGYAMDEIHWEALRSKVAGGMRNSNCMAVAPTATISNIVGVSQGIDPVYQNLFVKSNLSGEFTVVNRAMEADLAKLALWDDVMVNDLKYFDGSLAQIDRVPADLKRLYATAFEIDPEWLVQMAAHRQKWIDQAQSLNLYLSQPSGKKLDTLYRLAWRMGLKTTYYLRSLGATSAEKSTVERGSLNAVSVASQSPKACLIDDPTCEACQ